MDIRRRLEITVLLWLTCGASFVAAQGTDSELPKMQLLKTADGTHFGLFGEKPSAPAATLVIFATGIDEMGSDPKQYYSQTGRDLAKDGWLYVVLDPPCHGYDRVEGEPAALVGWAHRVKAGQDLVGPFVKRCVRVLDHLIAEGYTDPQRVPHREPRAAAFVRCTSRPENRESGP